MQDKRIFNMRGSALIMAMVTITVLLLLGLAVVTLSMGTLQANTADATTNKAYYAAEAGVNSALEQLKLEASSYYAAMLAADSADYTGLFGNFFNGISTGAQSSFTEPVINGVTTSTIFSTGSFDSQDSICEFIVTCTSTTSDGTKFAVEGRLYIKKIDVGGGGGSWFVNDAAIIAGGTLKFGATNGMTIKDSNVIVSALTHSRQWGLPYSIQHGQVIYDPTLKDKVNDVLKYPSYSIPAMTDIDLYITQNNTVINWSNVPAALVGITTAPGINISFSSVNVPAGVIYGKGNVTVSNGNMDADIYCDGNFTATSGTINGDIYCRGNVTLTNGNFNGSVICDGSLTLYGGSLGGSAICGGSINIHDAGSVVSLFATGPITVTRTNVKYGVVYSSTKISLGDCSTTAIYFSAGDIELTGSGTVKGVMIAKNDIYFTNDAYVYYTINYQKNEIDKIFADIDNSFFESGTAAPGLNENVIVNQDITALGRTN